MPLWVWAISGTGAAIGLPLLVWAVWGDRARGRRRCPRCWYDMSGTDSLKCPECGRAARLDRHLLRTRRRWRWAILAGIVVAGAAVMPVTLDAANRGWRAAPAPVLFALAAWCDLDVGPGPQTGSPSSFNYALAEASQRPLPRWEQRLLAWQLTRALRQRSDPAQRARAAAHIRLTWSMGDNMLMEACIPALLEAVDDPDPRVAADSSEALARMSIENDTRAALWERLASSPNDELRERAVSMLARQVKRGNTGYIPVLLRAAHDPDVNVVAGAVTGLVWSHEPNVVPCLVELMSSPDDYIRSLVLMRLGKMGSAAESAVPSLIDALNTTARHGRGAAAKALGLIGPGAKRAVPDLIHVLDNSAWADKNEAAIALSRIAPGDPNAIAAIRAATQNLLPSAALEALYRVGWTVRDQEQGEVHGLMTGGAAERVWGRMLLARSAGDLDQMVDVLISLCDSKDIVEAETAIRALGSMSERAKGAIPALRRLCGPIPPRGLDEYAARRYGAAEEALRAIDPRAENNAAPR